MVYGVGAWDQGKRMVRWKNPSLICQAVSVYARKWYLTLFIARGSSSNLIPKGVPIFSTFFSVHTNWQMNLQVQAQNLFFWFLKIVNFGFHCTVRALWVCACACMCAHDRACAMYVCMRMHAPVHLCALHSFSLQAVKTWVCEDLKTKRITDEWTDQGADGWIDSWSDQWINRPSYRDARTHLRITNQELSNSS